MENPLTVWSVPGEVERVIDGDTIVCRLDLGWRIYRGGEPVRIQGINCPELWTDAGKAAKVYAETILSVGMEVSVVSLKLLGSLDKYGRTLAKLTLPSGLDYGELMITAGYAEPYLT